MKRMRLFPESNYGLKKKFVLETSYESILDEGIHQSYDADKIYKILSKYYKIGNIDDFVKNNNDIGYATEGAYNSDGFLINNEIIVFYLIIPNGFKDTEKIKKFMETCGWTLAQEQIWNKNKNYSVYSFQKNRQIKEINDVPDYLYHLTPVTKLPKILRNGLTPRTTNILSNRPERIYFQTEKATKLAYVLFANELYKANLEKKLDISNMSKDEIMAELNKPRTLKYALLLIDRTKLNNIKFFGDPDMDGAVWTYDNITPKAITVLSKEI